MSLATLGQGNQVLNLLLRQNVPRERLQSLIDSGLISDLLSAPVPKEIDRGAFRELLGVWDPTKGFSVDVDWSSTLESKIKELIKLGLEGANHRITTENFPNPPGKGGCTVERVWLVKPSTAWSLLMEDLRRDLDERGLSLRHPQILCSWLLQYWERIQLPIQQGLAVFVTDCVWVSPDEIPYIVKLSNSGRGVSLRLSEDNGTYVDYIKVVLAAEK